MVGRVTLRLVLTALLLASCAPGSDRSTSSGEARTGGTLVFAAQEPETLHPFRSTGTQTNALVYRLAVEGLTSPGADGEAQPVLAEAVPTIANRGVLVDGRAMTVRWSIRPGLRWSDDAPVTSADVRFTWQAVMSDPQAASREGYDLMTDVETPDERTAVVRYREVDVAYTTRFGGLLPAHVLAGASAETVAAYARAPLGTGPFRITEFVSGDHVTAVRNDRYRVPGRPYLDRVIFRFVSSVEAAKAQLRAGEVDAADSLSEADAADLATEPALRVVSVPSPTVEAVAFNLSRPAVADTAVRRALLSATPKAQIADKLLHGLSRPGTSEIPLGWASPAGMSQESYDRTRSQALLNDAGWLPGPDGVRARDGQRLKLRIVSTTGNALREAIEQVLVTEWRAIGVELQIQNVPSSVLTGSWLSGGVRKRGDFDVLLATSGLGVTTPDPQSYLAQRHRCDAIPRTENNGAGANYERFCDSRVDALLDEAGQSLDRARRVSAYREVLSTLNQHVIAIWLYDRGRYDAYRSRIRGQSDNGWDVATWNIADWYRVE